MKLRSNDLDNLFSTTLANAITASDLTIYLNAVPTNATEGFLVLDTNNATKREVIYYNAVGANYVSCPALGGRGQAGTSAQSHDAGAAVKQNFLREHFKPVRDAVFTGFVELNYTATYASSSTITIPTDLTAIFTVGHKLKLTFASSGAKFFTILSSSYSSPNTTITLYGDTVLEETINSIEMDVNPQAYSDNDVIVLNEKSAAPGTPTSGKAYLYQKDDGKLYLKNDAGTESATGNDYSTLNAPSGFLINGKIVPSVASNNLTVAIKGMDGNDPSATNPVYCRIGDTVRSITSALSKTVNAGANSFNAGSAELATKEIDYFVYLGYNATDGVVIGFSRIPSANSYDDFSATATNEKYCAISTITNAAATDYYEVIGRFAATLSAGAGYTWSVPTFTAINLIQRPIYETRWLDYQPTYGGSGSMTYTSVTTTVSKYKIIQDTVILRHTVTGTTGGTASSNITMTLPFTALTGYGVSGCGITDGGSGLSGSYFFGPSDDYKKVGVQRYDGGNFGLGSGRAIRASGVIYQLS